NHSGAHTDHIKNDPFVTNAVSVLFDISDATPQPDGSYIWMIEPAGTLSSAADVLEVLSEGKAFLNIETAAYPDGEISGHFIQANGTPTFTPPTAPPAWPDDHSNSNAASL